MTQIVFILIFTLASSLLFADSNVSILNSTTRFVGSVLFNSHNSEQCSNHYRTSYCPSIIQKLVDDDNSTRAVLLTPDNHSCRNILTNLKKDPEYSQIHNPINFQNVLKKSLFANLGEYSHSTIRTCLNSPNSDNLEITSKYYYYLSKLNNGALRVAQDRIIISKLLHTKEPPCPSEDTLELAHQICTQFKNCNNSESIDDLATRSENDEKILEATDNKINSLMRDCQSEMNCYNTNLQKLQSIKAGILEKNPWFLDEDFINAGKIDPNKRFIDYFQKIDKSYEALQKNLEKTARCVHGSGNCDPDETRQLVSTLPEVKFDQLNLTKKNQFIAQQEFEAQSCLESQSLSKLKTSKILNAVYLQAGALLLTAGLGNLVTVTNYYRLTKLAPNASTGISNAVNLTYDTFNLAYMGDEINNSCFRKDHYFNLGSQSSREVCENSTNSLSLATKAHGQCLITSGLAALGLAMTVPIAHQSFQNISNAINSAGPKSLVYTRSIQNTSSGSTHPSLSRYAWKNKPLIFTNPQPVKLDVIPNPPPGIEIYKSINSENKTVYFFTYEKKLPNSNETILVQREFQLDPLTGAINATYSSGRELLDLLFRSKAGKGYLAFIDVANLGAVSKTFKNGDTDGDIYLKGVVETIQKYGNGKITIARSGGDEFTLLIDEVDPKKVQTMLTQIRDDLRMGQTNKANQLMVEEYNHRLARFQQNPNAENKKALDDFSRIQKADISIGSAQIGGRDALKIISVHAEQQAQKMKAHTAGAFGRDVDKYQVPGAKTSEIPNPNYFHRIDDPVKSNSWNSPTNFLAQTPNKNLRKQNLTRVETVNGVGNSQLASYKDEFGELSYRLEKVVKKPNTNQEEVISYEIPTKGKSQLPDGTHIESKDYILKHFTSSSDSTILMPKLSNLREINYFASGTHSGDTMLDLVAEAVKKEVRHNDLAFKMNGGDFILSYQQTSLDQLKLIQDRIVKSIKENPELKNFIQSEKNSLQSQLNKELSIPTDTQKIQSLRDKISAIENFQPKMEFEFIRRNEVNISNSTSFDDLYTIFDGKFKTSREKSEKNLPNKDSTFNQTPIFKEKFKPLLYEFYAA